MRINIKVSTNLFSKQCGVKASIPFNTDIYISNLSMFFISLRSMYLFLSCLKYVFG